ncbi:MAG TPA: TRAP transporter small permease subunit [Pseudomonadales bacterium]
MTPLIIRISQKIDAFTNAFGKSLSWLTLLMAMLTFAVVILRYMLNLGSVALQESVLYLHALVFMGASAYTLMHDGHVRVDVFYRRLSPKFQAWINLAGTLLLLFPVCIFITFISIRYVSSSWSILESSSEAGGLPGVFLLKSLIFLLSGTLLLQGVAEAIKNILIIADIVPAAHHKLEVDSHYNG